MLLEALKNVSVKHPETTQYIEENMSEVCESEKLMVEKLFYFVAFAP